MHVRRWGRSRQTPDSAKVAGGATLEYHGHQICQDRDGVCKASTNSAYSRSGHSCLLNCLRGLEIVVSMLIQQGLPNADPASLLLALIDA